MGVPLLWGHDPAATDSVGRVFGDQLGSEEGRGLVSRAGWEHGVAAG